MKDFLYGYIKENCYNKTKLCYVDTDGFMIQIKTEDCYKNITGNVVKCLIH